MEKFGDFDDEYDDGDFAAFDLDAAIRGTAPASARGGGHTNDDFLSGDVDDGRPSKKMRPTADDDDDDVPSHFRIETTDALIAHFGHSTFRPGQLVVLHSAMSGRDTCVFWATG